MRRPYDFLGDCAKLIRNCKVLSELGYVESSSMTSLEKTSTSLQKEIESAYKDVTGVEAEFNHFDMYSNTKLEHVFYEIGN